MRAIQREIIYYTLVVEKSKNMTSRTTAIDYGWSYANVNSVYFSGEIKHY